MWQRRALADIPTVQWRNGHGYTKVIAEGRIGSGLQWRLSVAALLKDAPFSIFTGWRRSFALLGQESVILSEKMETGVVLLTDLLLHFSFLVKMRYNLPVSLHQFRR